MKKTAFVLSLVCITMIGYAQLPFPDTSLYDSWAAQERQRLSNALQPTYTPMNIGPVQTPTITLPSSDPIQNDVSRYNSWAEQERQRISNALQPIYIPVDPEPVQSPPVIITLPSSDPVQKDISTYNSWAEQERERITIVTQPKTSSSIDKWIKDTEKAEKAAKAGDHKTACEVLSEILNSSQETDVNKASHSIELGLHYWCLKKDSEAKDAISKAIKYLKTGEFLGGGCEARAETLLKKISKLPRSMSYDEIHALNEYTMEPAYDQFHKEIDRKNAQLEVLTRKYESETNRLRREGDFQASMAKFRAKQDYEKSTGRTFDPNTRPKDAKELEKWEPCKRVYDIFEN